MDEVKVMRLHGRPIAAGRYPLICTPLVGADRQALLGEVRAVLPKGPDVLEWRADFFLRLGESEEVVEVARALKAAAGEVPLLFTCRSNKEGGQSLAIDADAVVRLLAEVCRKGCVDLVDYEVGNPPEAVRTVRAASREHDVPLILSYHNFQRTPDTDFLLGKFAEAVRMEADVVKVAVMPQSLEDVLRLLEVTLRGRRELPIPLITMSMGAFGSLSRMVGGVFGSALTFAVGHSSSAPGQVPIEELRTVLDIVRRSVAGA